MMVMMLLMIMVMMRVVLRYSNTKQKPNQIKETKMNTITKAEQVAQTYDDALRDNLYSKGCYELAIDAAGTLGGIEIDYSNITESYTSKVTFEFDDKSRAQITYGGVFVIC